MDITSYISVGISILGLLGGSISWALNLKIKHDLLENNASLEKELTTIKEKTTKDLSTINDNCVREITILKEKHIDRFERLDKELSELKSNLQDRILSTINGKYVRSDIHDQSVTFFTEKINSLKEVIGINIEKIEQGLDRQILDLKERIFHDNTK